ncbi:MAG TPA: DUF3043 domain-containing protein [Marmoricola sp.]
MFGRTKQDQTPEAARAVDESHASSEEKKGRPTPKRKDAEAAARERARMGLDEKAARKVLRERRMNETRKMREALKGGDEKNLPARDQGQVKRFVRDYVDSRLCIAEFLLVALVVTMFLTYRKDTQALGTSLQMVVVVLTLIDTGWLLFRLRRAIRKQFPGESLRGVNGYAVMRVLQMRFMRLPKPKVGLGGRPK